MAPGSLTCPTCRKPFKVKDYDPGRKYSCPACKGPLAAEASQAPTVASKPAEIGFRDEPPPPPREIPVRLGKYLIAGEVARGGVGVVYGVKVVDVSF
jgi:uncharacterized protein YbaR (Trm112 family)